MGDGQIRAAEIEVEESQDQEALAHRLAEKLTKMRATSMHAVALFVDTIDAGVPGNAELLLSRRDLDEFIEAEFHMAPPGTAPGHIKPT